MYTVSFTITFYFLCFINIGRKIGECQLDASTLIRQSEENLNTGDNTKDDTSFELGSNHNPNNIFRNGKKFLHSDGNVYEDCDSGAVVVRSSTKQNRASPACDVSLGYNAVVKDQSQNGDTSIEAGCEILCLKFLSGLEGIVPIPRGKLQWIYHVLIPFN